MTSTARRVPQLLLPGQAAAPEGPVDATWMYVMHRAFRRDLAAFADVVPTVGVGDGARWTQLRRRFAYFGSCLHKHHHSEDVALWPLLAERGGDRAVLDALEAEHAGIDPLLAAISAGLSALATGAGSEDTRKTVASCTCRLRDALGAHLGHEERDGMAQVQGHLTQADWDRLDKEVFGKDYRPWEVPAFLGWVTSGLAPEAAQRIPGANPVSLVFASVMARRFERREARLFGGSR
jgi:hypothetical protein